MRSLIAAALIAACVPALAQTDWIHLTGDDEITIYGRAGSIHEVAGLKRAWFLVDRSTSDSIGSRSRVSLNEFNCDTGEWRVLQTTNYKSQMGKGESLGTDRKATAWSYVTPGTFNELLIEVVCAS
jgi:hypothetical protein